MPNLTLANGAVLADDPNYPVDTGTTANRPTSGRELGMQYWDTTLGRPIWWNGAAWVDAAGVVV